MVIGFFMPLPLAMMIPFMGIQSMVMAKQFGENFQYGKRRISAMSNDEFNKLTPAKLLSNANAELRSQIPLMKESMEDMRQFQTFIVKEFLLTIRSIIDAGLGKLIGLTPTEINQTVQNIEHFLHGHFEGHAPTEGPTDSPIGKTPSPFIPDQKGQATIPSVAFLNSLNRSQLKAIRNDALRGDYTTDSTKLILARYKEIFEFDKGASIPDSFKPGIPLHTLDQNARNFQTAVVITAWPLIGKLRIASLKGAKGAKEVINMTNRWYAENRSAREKAKGDTAKRHFTNVESELLRLIGLRNKWLQSGKSFTL